MMKAKVRFLCHFCNLTIISEHDTIDEAFLRHIQTCIGMDKVREKLEH